MAKQKKKLSAKAELSALPGLLPKGEAAIINRGFFTRLSNSGASNLPNFPQVVCFTVSELRSFLDLAEKTVNPDPANPVPANQIGVAIIPAWRNAKVTFALVATRFTEDRNIQQVLSINNPVTGIHYASSASKALKKTKKMMLAVLGTDPPVGDAAYDSGSVWP